MSQITIKTTVNSIGIIMTIIGVWALWKTSPTNFSIINAGAAIDNWKTAQKKTADKNRIMNGSVILILTGSFLQLLSNFIPE